MIKQYIEQLKETADRLYTEQKDELHNLVFALGKLQRDRGRLFILGVGGSAANASHAVNDFRKLTGIESYTSDNLAEITARTNDEGWESVFEGWLRVNNLTSRDAVFVFSVGGGNEEKKVSINIVNALKYAKSKSCKVWGIVGRDGGYTKKVADICVVIPTVNEYLVTPFVESFQAILLHMLVFHPDLQINLGKWESISQK